MSLPPDSLENHLLELLHATRDDNNATARTRLNDLLRNEPSARAIIARLLVNEQALINRLRQDDMVATLRPVVWAPQAPARRSLRQVSKSTAAWPALAAAAVLVLGAALGWFVMRPASGNAPSSAALPVAVLKAAADAVWSDATPAPGTSLAPGRLRLKSGMASFEFTSGARVLLEGPAEVELVSGMEILCRSGNLRADVPPPAHGFTIITPSTRVVDLGTSFGLSVRADGSALVKVMQGAIELRRGDAVYPMITRASASIDPTGTPSPADVPDEAFPSEENFRERIAAGERQTAARWKAASAKLANDPATLLSFTFQETTRSSRSVRNQAATASLESHGSLVGADWTSGRWPGKRALEFKGRSDSLRFKLDRTAPSATLLAWVRVNSLPNSFNILLSPDYHQHTSALQWMITRNGELRLAMTNGLASPASQKGWDGPVMAPAISSLDLGRWVFLASTYDSQTGRVFHYRDGRPVGSGSFEHRLPVKFGAMSFGNWPGRSRNDARQDVDSADREDRNFVGSLDELVVLSRALPPSEIQAIYRQGKP
jgi:hypothetical protein